MFKLRVEGGGPAGRPPRVVSATGLTPGLGKGQRVRLGGAWAHDPTYGPQLKVTEWAEVPPQDAGGMLAYLAGGRAAPGASERASGRTQRARAATPHRAPHPASPPLSPRSNVPGVGPATAGRLVAAFGGDVMSVLSAPDAAARLLSVPGFGPASAAKLAAAVQAGAGARAFAEFLRAGLGLPPPLAAAAARRLGPGAEAAVRGDPYGALLPLRGATFAAVDGAAAALGFGDDHPARLAAALVDALSSRAQSDGHSYLSWAEAEARAQQTLARPRLTGGDAAAMLMSGGDVGPSAFSASQRHPDERGQEFGGALVSRHQRPLHAHRHVRRARR